jgi:ribonuclease HI
MWVTIIADASYCPDTQAAGYGFWIASDRGKRGGHGGIKERVVNSIAAEMMALVNGLYMACRYGLADQGDTVLLQTDCQAAIDAFTHKRARITHEETDLVSYLETLAKDLQLTVMFKHVKGHTSGGTPRLFINNKCDELARDAMRKMRGQFRSNTNETETLAVPAATRNDHSTG